jgi:site-specific recombinase XerC
MEAKGGALIEAAEWFLDHLRHQKGASEHTLAAYRNDLFGAARFLSGLGLSRWEELEPPLVTRYQTSLGKLAPATAQRKLSALRSLLKFLKKNRHGPEMDLPDTGGFRKARRLPKSLTPEQVDALMAAPDLATPGGLRDRAVLELLYGCSSISTTAAPSFSRALWPKCSSPIEGSSSGGPRWGCSFRNTPAGRGCMRASRPMPCATLTRCTC